MRQMLCAFKLVKCIIKAPSYTQQAMTGNVTAQYSLSKVAVEKKGMVWPGVVECFCVIDSQPDCSDQTIQSLWFVFEESIGVSGCSVLDKYADLDLLSSFLVRVKCLSSKVIAISLKHVLCKCTYIKQSSANHGFVVKLL